MAVLGRLCRGVYAALALTGGWVALTLAPAVAQDRTALMVEALQRLKGQDLAANPALARAVSNVLDRIQGTPAFIEVVRDFRLTNQNPALVRFAVQHPRDPATAEALRTLFAHGGIPLLEPELKPHSQALALVPAMADTGDSRIVRLLRPMLLDTNRPVELRREAVRASVRVLEGAEEVLRLAQSGDLPPDVRLVAATELNTVRWETVRQSAAQVLPPPAARGDSQLPSISELRQRHGDATQGAAVFRRSDVNCISCHRIRGEGVDFGPDLSEIGTKLGREALYESILDPSAGISFGFEAWVIGMKSGDELFGLLASETEDELVLKLQGGSLTRLRKAEIASRAKQGLSIMPAGLSAALTVNELVDLVEYLSSLKKMP